MGACCPPGPACAERDKPTPIASPSEDAKPLSQHIRGRKPNSGMPSYGAIFQPLLEVLFAWLGLSDIWPALGHDPLDEHLLQVRIVLLVNLLLNFPAESIGRSSVGHSDGAQASLQKGEEAKKKEEPIRM